MSHANPTPIRIGMKGTFAGKPYTIIARVVMSMEQDGETYYWNEFYLSDLSDRIAMLVCEEGETGLTWRLFTEFIPAQPLTAREASTRKPGDRVNLDGINAEVTLVDQSRVEFIEGNAPDWVSVGDVANYFNVEGSGKMWVVSWSGDEVEYYRGLSLPPQAVTQALNLPLSAIPPQGLGGVSSAGASAAVKSTFRGCFSLASVLFGAVPLVIVLARGCQSTPSTNQWSTPASHSAVPAPVVAPVPQPPPPPPPPPPLQVGADVPLAGQSFRVLGQATVSAARVNARWNRHEFLLGDGSTTTHLLVIGATPDSTDWLLLRRFEPQPTLEPPQAAARRFGESVTLGDFNGTVTDIYLTSVSQTVGEARPHAYPGQRNFHFLASAPAEIVMARWDASEIAFYRGSTVKPPPQ